MSGATKRVRIQGCGRCFKQRADQPDAGVGLTERPEWGTQPVKKWHQNSTVAQNYQEGSTICHESFMHSFCLTTSVLVLDFHVGSHGVSVCIYFFVMCYSHDRNMLLNIRELMPTAS